MRERLFNQPEHPAHSHEMNPDHRRGHDEERLGRLLGVLPPAPEGWVQAAQELPRAWREMDERVL